MYFTHIHIQMYFQISIRDSYILDFNLPHIHGSCIVKMVKIVFQPYHDAKKRKNQQVETGVIRTANRI